ncbi:MAG TPA: pilin [Candidatus Paceibacterota bacterium]|nr:pilin [Candidatus Paceibacterota bacterium]
MEIKDIIIKLGNLLDTLLPVLVLAGVVIFVWGVIQYVIGGDEEAKSKGKNRIIWGIVGFAIIAGLYGLINIVLNTFGLDPSSGNLVSPTGLVPATPTPGTCEGTGNIGSLICKIGTILNSIIPLLISFGVVIFVWGVVQYVIGGDEEAKSKGKDRMIWGIIGLVVIASMWGLVNMVVKTFDLNPTGSSGVANQFLQNTSQLGNTPGTCSIAATGASLGDLMNYATCLITKSVIPLIFSLAVLLFVWGVVQYVISGANEEQKDKGKNFMIWGIIALTVMVSVWGIVRIVGDTFGIEYAIPQVKSR